MERKDRIRLMREHGMTYSHISDIEGISEQQVRWILNKQSALALSIASAARLVGIHPNTLRRWAKEGKVKYYRVGSRGDRRFKKQDVERLLRVENRR